MRVIFGFLCCLLLGGCFDVGVEPFNGEKQVHPLPESVFLHSVVNVKPGKNFNPLSIFTGALNEGVPLKKRGSFYVLDLEKLDTQNVSKSAEDFSLSFYEVASREKFYFMQFTMSEREKNRSFVLLAKVKDKIITPYVFNPKELQQKSSGSFDGSQTDPGKLRAGIEKTVEQFFNNPELVEQAIKLGQLIEARVYDFGTDGAEIEVLMAKAKVDRAKKEAAKAKKKAERDRKRRFEKLLESAEENRKADRFDAALEEYNEYLAVHRNDKKALKGRIDVYVELEKNDLAYNDYDTLIATYPDEAEHLNDKAFRQYLENDYKDAIDTFNRYLQHPNARRRDSASHYKAQAHLRLEQYEDALEIYKHLIAKPKSKSDYYREISAIFDTLGNTDRAIFYLTEALDEAQFRFDTDRAWVLKDRARLYSRQERFNAALDDWNAVLSIDGNSNYSASSYYHRGRVLISLELYAQAIEDLTTAIFKAEYAYDRRDPFWYRGYANLSLEKYQKAVEDYSSYIELDSESSSAFNNRGIAYRELGQTNRAREDFKRAKQLKEVQ